MDQDDDRAAYTTGLRLLVGRELSRAQLRERLVRRGFSPETADATVGRLATEGAVDDRRVALMHARSAVAKHRGRDRAVREMQQHGIAPALAKQALAEVFGTLDERRLLERALARRLTSARIESPAEFRRLHAYLVRQGFPPGDVVAALRARSRGARVEPEDED
jgi:regulatory protein